MGAISKLVSSVSWSVHWLGLGVGLGLIGCSGQIADPAGGPGGGPTGGAGAGGQAGTGGGRAGEDGEPSPTEGVDACAERDLPGQPLRRLSSTQYQNTLRQLLGADLAEPLGMGSLFPATTVEAGFVNDAEANLVNTAESNAIEDDAERIATLVLADPAPYLTALLPCSLPAAPADAEIDACIDDFIADFGGRAYRRPLTTSETEIVRGLYDAVRAEQTAAEGFAALLQFFVQSPALLYRVERGADEAAPGLLRLTDHEMASRLSYFFLDSMPDAELFAAAEAGELSTRKQVRDQAVRLLDEPAFVAAAAGFHRDWLQLYRLEQGGKDQGLYPEYTSEVRDSLLDEVSHFVTHVLDDLDGNVESLLGSASVPVNSVLADFYGVSVDGAGTDTWSPAELDDRRGIFTLASTMAAQADTDSTHPIHRGVFFQREVLCNALPTFPGNIDTVGPLQDTSMLPTARERLAPLLSNGQCMGCHTLFNPTGLAFESYDAVGRWRDTENGAAIDTTGSLGLDGAQHAFETPLELSEAVASSEQARDCYTLQWYRAALGRREFAEDACSLAVARQAATDSGGDLRELLLAITQTDGFLYRRVDEDEVAP
jgi:hypothetical protein